MILELVTLSILPGREGEFESAVAKSVPLFKGAKGCHKMSLRRSVDKASQYWLLILWETKENHTVDFVSSPQFREFGALVGPYFASAPVVDHAEDNWTGF